MIMFMLLDAINGLFDLGLIGCSNVVSIFHRGRSRRSYAKENRRPMPEYKPLPFYDGLPQGYILFEDSWMLNEIPAVLVGMLGHFECKLSRGWHGSSSVEIVQSACNGISIPCAISRLLSRAPHWPPYSLPWSR